MPTGWAILGTGRHPELKAAPAIHRAPDARLVAVLSREQQRAEAAAAQFGAERGYSDLATLLADPEIDAVWVCTPNALHASQTLRALDAGKHVLCEKPMALSVEDAVAMLALAARRGLQLGIGFHLRHHPGYRAARQAVQSGSLGDITYARAQWAVPLRRVLWGSWWGEPEMAGAGILMGTGVHAIDLLRAVLGREVSEVFAWDDAEQWEKPIDFSMMMLLRFEGGAFAHVAASRRFGHPVNELTVYGTAGRLSAPDLLWEELRGALELATDEAVQRWEFRRSPTPLTDLYTAQVEAFMRAMSGDAAFEASAQDGLAVVRITEAVIESARSGRPVAVGP